MEIKKLKALIVCSDPGASQEVLFLYRELEKRGADTLVVARNSGLRFASGLGIGVCRKKQAYANYRSIEKFILRQGFGLILTGTSLRDDLEREYIKAGRELGIAVISFIDWWTNFRERFIHTRSGQFCLPSAVCVIDNAARRMCRAELGKRVRIVITGNPYFSYVRSSQRKAKALRRRVFAGLKLAVSAPAILFFAEPDKPYLGYDQFKIFRHIAREIAKTSDLHRQQFNLVIKFHPNGEADDIFKKYARIAKELLGKRCRVAFVKRNYHVHELIDAADYVWGMNTTPLLEAMIRGKLVSSFLPAEIFRGIPFLRRSGFCPSAFSYSQFPGLIRDILTNEKFARAALKKQSRYVVPDDIFYSRVFEVIKQLPKRGKKWLN